MQSQQTTKADNIAVLRKIYVRDGRVSLAAFKEETGWGRYWFDKHWPTGGYQSACEEASVKRGEILGVETNLRVTDEELALKFAEVVKLVGKIPSSRRFSAVARMNPGTMKRGASWNEAKRRVIIVYFGLSPNHRKGEAVDSLVERERLRLNGQTLSTTSITPNANATSRYVVDVPDDYISLVRKLVIEARKRNVNWLLNSFIMCSVTSAPEYEANTNTMTFACMIDAINPGWLWR